MSLAAALRAIIAAEQSPRQKAIAARPRKTASLPSGFADPRQREGTRRIALTLDDATFARVRKRADKNNISFAAAARELIELGCGIAERPQ
jgi:hypothetical protein